MRAVQAQWFATAVGKAMNPDNAYELQCVDVPDHYAEAIFPGVPWQTSVGGVNGAKDLLAKANREYWEVIYNDPNNQNHLPAQGDVLVWGGSPANQYGHTAVADVVDQGGARVVQQNSNGLANQAAHVSYLPWWGPGTGMLTGWLRPRADRMPRDPVAAATTRTVTAERAWVRIRPDHKAPLVPDFPGGLARGAKVAVVGYVKGTDPFGNGNDAWFKTRSGYYVWCNNAGNSLAGLAKL